MHAADTKNSIWCVVRFSCPVTAVSGGVDEVMFWKYLMGDRGGFSAGKLILGLIGLIGLIGICFLFL